MNDTTREELAYERAETEYKRGVRAAVGIIAVLCGLCVLASLSGCLTATKIHRWESALLGWARKGGPECVGSAQVASRYLVNANRTLAGATSVIDLTADREARKLMQDAAQKCGEVVP